MDANVARALDRLRDPDGAALRELATLVVREATATPVAELASPRWIAGQIATALEALTRGDMLRQWADGRLDHERDRWSKEERPLRHWVPPEVEDPLRRVVGRPWTPDQELTLRIIDQPAMRDLISEILEDTLQRFARRVRNLDAGMGGLGGRALKRGRGLLGNIAGDLVGAVAEEVEGAVDRRVKEFVGGATQRAMRSIVKRISDPNDAEAYGQFRMSVLDVILDTPLRELAAEADKLAPEEILDVVTEAVKRLVAREDFVEDTTRRVEAVLSEAGDGTLAAWLDEVGLTEVWTETTVDLVTARLQAVVATDAFVGWWGSLFDQPAEDSTEA